MFYGGIEERLREMEDTVWNLGKKPVTAIVNAIGVLEKNFTFVSSGGRVELEINIITESDVTSSLIVNDVVNNQLDNFYQVALNTEMNKEYHCKLIINYGQGDSQICKIKIVGKDIKYEINI